MWSQSLRKSGQFLSCSPSTRSIPCSRRNPFVNQVSFFTQIKPGEVKHGTGSQSLRKSGQFLFDDNPDAWLDPNLVSRNPFVNQVSFFLWDKRGLGDNEDEVAIPS